ncbi:MAG TPA: LCP family protein [Trebonia sp.]|jgi:LCP family protein required for cell wall assembly|nr:LCP family protein [Trebonia sp.]
MRGATVLGKVGYAASCLLAAVVLVVSGYAHKVTGLVTGLASSNAISGGAQTGAMNILVMGLESRTDYQGNTLSSALLTAMHAGSVYGVNNQGVGGQDTNTLILIHIFAGGQKAVGYSIPRDDWVTFPHAYDGQSAGKIDQAYGLAYAQSLNETVSSSMSRSQRYFQANEAGQKATIDTVAQVTNQKIDHFAEVNLAGFFYLAQSFGGIEVCVKSWDGPDGPGTNLHDANSGFNQRHAGYLHLAADQALAFVRERDNLPNGDLDRTHRQQAVLDYVIWKLKTEGVLTDLGQLTALLGTADKYLITDSSWKLLYFSTQMHALSGENLKFYTAPIVGYETIDGQDANQIDIPAIQAAIKAKFTAPAPAARGAAKSGSKPAKKAAPIPAASTVTVDVYNGGSTSGLAGNVSAALVAKGYRAGVVTDASSQSQAVKPGDQVFYGAGASANAAKIGGYFGATATALASLPKGHVEVLLGTGSAVVPSALAPATSPSSTPSASSTAGNNGAAGTAVTVTANAKFGIPCVY